MASTDDLVRLGGNVATRGGAPAVRPPPVPTEGLRTYTPEQMSQLGAPKAPLQIGGPSPVPAVQAPLYTPEDAPQLGVGRQAAGIGGPSANLPARQAPMYTPEQAPRLGASPAASGISVPPAAAAAPAEAAAGPLSRAAGLLGTIGKGIGVGAIADQALRAVDPQDNMGAWIDKNVPGASWVDNAASHIGLGRSYAEQQAADAPQLGARRGIIPTAAAATMPQTAGAPAAPTTPAAATQDAAQAAEPSQGYTDELQRIQGQAAAEQPPQAAAPEAPPPPSAPSSAPAPDAGAPNPISFITYGAAQGADGGSGALVTNKDGTQAQLDTRQPLPADVQAFNALNQQAGQNAEPVQIIRGMDQTTAIPNGQGAPMQEVPQDVASGGPTAINGFLAARQQNALNQADPLKAKTDADIRKDMVMQGMGDPTAPGGAGAAGMAATQGLSGDDYLKTLQPSRAATLKAIDDGRVLATPYLMARTPGLLNQLNQAYPNFDITKQNDRYKTAQSFQGAGQDASSVKSINQAIGHASEVMDAIQKLDNHNGVLTPLNYIANPLSEHILGDARQGVFRQKAQALSSELRTAFSKSGGSLKEVEDWKASLPESASRDQQVEYLKSGLDLLGRVATSLQSKADIGTGRPGFIKVISPESQAILDKINGKAPATSDATDKTKGQEQTYTPNDKSIAYLKANPGTRAKFDALYGPGASNSVLGK